MVRYVLIGRGGRRSSSSGVQWLTASGRGAWKQPGGVGTQYVQYNIYRGAANGVIPRKE
jgi:hypothetical protein